MRSIRVRLIGLLLITLLPAFLLLALVANRAQERARVEVANEARTMARLLGSQFSYLIESTREKLEMVGLFEELRTGDAATCDARLEQIYARMDGYSAMYDAKPDGSIVCAATATKRPEGESRAVSVADRPYFQTALASRSFSTGGSQIGEISGRRVMVFAMPILDELGNVLRVIGAGRDIDLLSLNLGESNISDQSSLIILDDKGVVVQVQPNPGDVVGTVHPSFDLIRQAAERGNVVAGNDLFDGTRSYVAFPGYLEAVSPLTGSETESADGAPETPAYYAVVGFTEERATGALWNAIWATTIALAFVTLAALVVSWFGAEVLIIRRIKRLAAAARQMTAGDLTVRTHMDGGAGEFGELGVALDTLASSLQVRQVENDRLLQEVASFNSDLEARMEVRTQELRMANTRLQGSQQELRRLTQQLMRMTEQERTRISREIHDQLGQSLTAIKMEVRAAQRTLESTPADAQEQLNLAVSQVDEMVVIVRRIAANLRPGVLDDFGIAAAINFHTQEFCDRTGIVCDCDMDLDEKLISSEMATAAYRITQEALTNVARHAQATHVKIGVRTHPDAFVVEIRDNGVGFVLEDASERSLGLLGMRERAAELGGTVDLESTPGNGVLVRLTLPYAVVKAEQERSSGQ